MLSTARYGTRDLSRAKPFYDAIAGLLGASCVFEPPGAAAYQGPGGAVFIIGVPYEGEHAAGNGGQMSFAAPSRAVVDAAYAKAIELGGKCAGAPGERGPDYPNGFYGAYFRDLDGNKLLVFHLPG